MASTKSQKLEDQAATAALYVTRGKGNQSKNKTSNYPLDEDNKLSSASAATSLKHADPRDLPSFPSVGLSNTDSSAGAAASLANANQHTFEHWKPGNIPAASKAAMLAKDYKSAPLWHPELSAAGSKAALLAQKDGGQVNIWRPEGTDAGHSAAGQAMRMKGLSPQLDYGRTADGEKRAMMAATGAMSSSRKRSGSTPIVLNTYPDSANSAANALKAATSVSRPSTKSPPPNTTPTGAPIDAARIHNAAITNLSREMYTSNPPVAPEVEEKNRQAGLRAAAISMAKQMYDIQQKAIEETVGPGRSDSQYAATSVHGRPMSAALSDETQATPKYANLQEAAQKLATERLAKLHDEHSAYRTYYGTQQQPQHRLSIRGRTRRRASSDGQSRDSDDEERSRQIRTQMSLFTDKLAHVDDKKRQRDRDSLLAAAQRNVKASMHGMDEKVFNQTGKVSPAMMEEWEAKAKAKADADSESRMVNHGRVNIGGGKYLDQSEVDAIAAAKVQPTLDEITETAEKHRARDEELRQQQLERERIAVEKATDEKQRAAQTKDEWKRFKEEEKREARAKKEEEKAKKAEDKRLRDLEKRRSKDAKVAPTAMVEEPKEEPIVTESQPPVLDPIPTVEPISTPRVKSIAVDAPVQETLPAEEERIAPTFIPISEREPMNTEEAELEPVATEDSELAPVYTPETGEVPSGDLSRADIIAQRVFSAPVNAEPSTAVASEPAAETHDLAVATSNTEKAPIIGSEQHPPTVEADQAPALQKASAPAIQEASTPAESPAPSAPSQPTKPEASAKPDTPVASRIAPTVPSTMQTTVTGPEPTKPTAKDSGKVSSWLKTKFSRRASKPAKPEPNTTTSSSAAASTAPTTTTEKSAGKEKGFIGGATLAAAPEVSAAGSSDPGDSSVKEVAMAGKVPTNTTNTSGGTSDAPVVSPTGADDDLYTASPRATGATQRASTESPSISSLSSDEDTRGRSAVRLGDTFPAASHLHPKPTTHAEPTAHTRLSKGESSSAGGGEEFEEARDTFDSEKLSPPSIGGVVSGVGGRASDSPARDSKFMENL